MEIEWMCQHCGRAFRQKSNCKRHELTCKANPINVVNTNLVCRHCGKPCKNDNSLRNHERLCPSNSLRNYISHTLGKPAWSRGLTKYTDSRLNKMANTQKANIRNGVVTPYFLGKKLTKEHREAISKSMKLAHQEKRAHNIGESRWNTEHSWPEKWFISVLKNELNMVESVDYKTEMPYDKYSLDFAWPEKKLCIEIDGEQHDRFEEYKKRDLLKDELLTKNGWQVVRIKWKDCYANPKQYIEKVKLLF